MRLSSRWFLLLSLSAVLMVISDAWPFCGVLSIALAVGVAVVSVVDAILLPGAHSFRVGRTAASSLQVRAGSTVTVAIANVGNSPWTVTVHEEPPAAVQHQWSDTTVHLESHEEKRLLYAFEVRERGTHSFGNLWLEVRGRLGLVSRVFSYPLQTTVRGLLALPSARTAPPSFQRLRRTRVGGRLAPLSGTGREFESLRDYLPDDDFRRIDWKASARRGRLTSREYQLERSQNVLLVLDLGRTMIATIEGRSKLDHAILAAMGLAQAASVCDDRVGLCAFDDEVRLWLPPRRGRSHLLAVTNALNDLTTRRVEANYRLVADTLKERCRTRSLVVLFTDIWDPDSSAVLRQQVIRLHPPHLPLCVVVSDSNVVRRALERPGRFEEAYEMAVAVRMLEEREAALGLLRAQAVMVVDSPADKVSADLINRYLDLKRRLVL